MLCLEKVRRSHRDTSELISQDPTQRPWFYYYDGTIESEMSPADSCLEKLLLERSWNLQEVVPHYWKWTTRCGFDG